MSIPLYDQLDELETNYNSWLKPFIYDILKKISNNENFYLKSTAELRKYFDTVCVSPISVTDAMERLIIEDDDSNFKKMYITGVKHDEHIVSIRHVFYEDNFTNIIKVIEYLISVKDMVKSKHRNYVNAVGYLESFLNNIRMLSIFVDDKDILNSNIKDGLERMLDSVMDRVYFEETDGKFQLVDDSERSSESIWAYSFEEDKSPDEGNKEIDDVKSDRERTKSIGKAALKVKNAIDTGRLKVKNFFDKFNIPRDLFYKNNIGKIDHLYKHYAGEATVVENDLLGDPVEILMEKCGPYLAGLIDKILGIYHNYNNHMNKLFQSKSYSDMIKEVESYLSFKGIQLNDKSPTSDVKKAIAMDVRHRVAKALLDGVEVYGYTVASITEKKYPPIHHVMVSLFMEKPHEKPTERSVGDVFKSADSFKLMGREMKKIVMESSQIVNQKLAGVSVENDFKKITGHMKSFKQHMNHSKLEVNSKSEDASGSDKEKSRDLKKMLSILKDHKSILESFIPLFIYVSEAGNVMYDIAMKIDFTCQDALKSLLNIERSKSDPRYRYDTSRNKDMVTSVDKENGTNQVNTGSKRRKILNEARQKQVSDSGTTEFNY